MAKFPLVFAPLVLMIGVAAAALVWVGSAVLVGIGMACLPYLVLAASARALCRRTSEHEDALWFVVPAVAIAALHVAGIVSYLDDVAVRAARPHMAGGFISTPENMTQGLLCLTGILFSMLAGVWWFIVLGIVAVRAKVRRRPGECWACRYDRTGLPPGAACPECGAAGPPAAT